MVRAKADAPRSSHDWGRRSAGPGGSLPPGNQSEEGARGVSETRDETTETSGRGQRKKKKVRSKMLFLYGFSFKRFCPYERLT